MYSVSEEDLEIVYCFLARHDIREDTMKKQRLVFNILESTHPTQFSSTWPRSCDSDFLKNKRP